MLRTLRFPLRNGALTALVACVLALGCSKSGDGPTDPGGGGSTLTQDDADDLAVQAVIAVSPWGVMIESSGAVSAPGALATRPRSGGFRLDSALGDIPVWYDTTLVVGNLTIELSRRYYDLFGDPQDQVTGATDSAYATSRVHGSVANEQFEATYGQSGWIGIGGLNPMNDVIHVAGQSSDTLTTHFTALYAELERFCESRALTTLSGIAWAKPEGAPTYPSTGTATVQLVFTRFTDGSHGTIEKTVNATIVIAFNGTATPNVTVNGTWHYQWNLDTGTVVRVGGA
jgi:hypothetical protein